MPIQKTPRDAWGSWLVRLSNQLTNGSTPRYSEVRMRSSEEGAQGETPWLPLGGVSYDRRENLLEISVEGRARLGFYPKELHSRDVEGRVFGIRVERKDGTEEVIELR
jgi:hypothetical protein